MFHFLGQLGTVAPMAWGLAPMRPAVGLKLHRLRTAACQLTSRARHAGDSNSGQVLGLVTLLALQGVV
jgi:hypothetical protein